MHTHTLAHIVKCICTSCKQIQMHTRTSTHARTYTWALRSHIHSHLSTHTHTHTSIDSHTKQMWYAFCLSGLINQQKWIELNSDSKNWNRKRLLKTEPIEIENIFFLLVPSSATFLPKMPIHSSACTFEIFVLMAKLHLDMFSGLPLRSYSDCFFCASFFYLKHLNFSNNVQCISGVRV